MKIEKALSPFGRMKLIEGPNFSPPEYDIEVAPKLLNHSVEKSAGTFARLYRPQRTLAFTSRDRSTNGYENAIIQANNLGFNPVVRSPGGRAVAYHEESLVIDILSRDPDPHKFINERFKALGEIFIESLAKLNVEARLGQLPFEFCPGKYSVVNEKVKLVGTAQRIKRGGWLISGSVVVRNSSPVREVLNNVYRALNLEMDPNTVGSVADLNSEISVDDLNSSIISTLKEHFEIIDIDLQLNMDQAKRELANV